MKGAFIKTGMTGTPVYIKCVGTLCKLIVETYPRLKAYLDDNGALYCKLKKALYGCVQALKLWYKQFCSFLQELSYERSDIDLCLFRKVIGERVYILLVYVDDILVCTDEQEVEFLKQEFVKRYMWIMIEVGNKHSYLGMQVTIKPRCVKINMQFYIEKILADFGELLTFKTPATKDLFLVQEKAYLNESQ